MEQKTEQKIEQKMEKIRKGIKADSIFVLIVILIMTVLTVVSVADIIRYSQKDSSAFEMKLDQVMNKENYCLFIDGENYITVDYNEYANTDTNGNTNEKMCLIIDSAGNAVSSIMLGALFLIAYFMMRNIVKESKPFSRENINRLRVMAVTTMLAAIIPGIVKMLMTFAVFLNATVQFSQISFLVLVLGVLLGVISEVFRYGYELQEDMDQIA